MPLVETRGAASAQGFGFLSGQATAGLYIEDVFSTFLYTGNGSTQTITNGIDLATQGGLVWTKIRSVSGAHRLVDSARGYEFQLQSDTTNSQATASPVWNFAASTTGYSLNTSNLGVNNSGDTYASWTFRKAPKFFDVVTYTGNGANRTIAHNLGSVPGCIIVKRLDTAADWQVYHRSLANTDYLVLNSTAASATGTTRWNSTTPTSTVFSLGTDTTVNASGGTYVAYIFAHDAGGFGASGTDNVISCGSFTSAGTTTGNVVNLGWEPQFLLCRSTVAGGSWVMLDTSRGMPIGNSDSLIFANTNQAEFSATTYNTADPNATGFQAFIGDLGTTTIYIAIRRGPMRTPTSGTSVLGLNKYSATSDYQQITTGNLVDLGWQMLNGDGYKFFTRLIGAGYLNPASTAAENTSAATKFDYMDGFAPYYASVVSTYNPREVYGFRRAPGFFDEICFSGTGSNTTQTHNLGSAPELWLVKSRSNTTEWVFGSSLLGANEKIVMPSPNGRVTDATVWNSTYPTASVLSLGTSSTTNASGQTFVGYLWATVAGVSKVGTYTGNGGSQTINCGFTSGARFVMIIRATASTSQDIYIWDSARGIVAGNDPRLSLNTTAAEVTTLDTVDTDSTGFVVNTDASNVNVSSAVYLYLAIA